MSVVDYPDWTKAIYAYQGTVSATQDFPDWTDAIFVTGGISPPASTPSTVPNLLAWWDATTINGVADGAALGAWPSLVSSTYSLQQTSAAAKPTYYSTTAAQLINGKPTVRFNGGQVLFVSPVQSATAQPLTVWMVAGVTSTSGTQYLFDNDSGSAGVSLHLASGNWVLSGGTALTGPAAATGAHLFVAIANGASSSIQVDGSIVSGAGGANGLQVINIGSTNLGANYLTGFFVEGGVYTRAINVNEVASIRAYTQAKWGTP